MNPEEITSIIKDQIKNYAVDLNVDEVGTVIETGHRCEFIQPGDIVMYPVPAEVPVPFYKFGWVAVNENRLLCVINEKLTERKNGR